jgi:hypothetical protein
MSSYLPEEPAKTFATENFERLEALIKVSLTHSMLLIHLVYTGVYA